MVAQERGEDIPRKRVLRTFAGSVRIQQSDAPLKRRSDKEFVDLAERVEAIGAQCIVIDRCMEDRCRSCQPIHECEHGLEITVDDVEPGDRAGELHHRSTGKGQ